MIFGVPVLLKNINWHLDYQSNFEFPKCKFHKMHIDQWFNKGIDVKFPWEVSRFQFAILLSSAYRLNQEIKYYNQFKTLIIDWIAKNPFLYGINWVCPMEVSIRSINWIIACNIFGSVFENDLLFRKLITKSLIQHAEYIASFPEKFNKEHTTNHTASDYAGLLFLSLTLEDHKKSKRWLKQAIIGLENCMEHQVYDDGVDFEASIPYHRLVLEIFSFCTILCIAKKVNLSKQFYKKLFKMFEYTAAYIDHNGNAPQVGDNDSGRILIFHQSGEHDHSYLLGLGEHIFEYHFESQCQKRNDIVISYLPILNKCKLDNLEIYPRQTFNSIAFEVGGAYILKNDNFSVFTSCFPLLINGHGGHNHYDYGSFTLSYKGNPIVVDPGSYTYTRNKNRRNAFRSVCYHNVSIAENEDYKSSTDDFWDVNSQFFTDYSVIFDEKSINIFRKNSSGEKIYWRNVEIFTDSLVIEDVINMNFHSYLHFHPDIKINFIDKNTVIINNYNILIQTDAEISLAKYYYSPQYNIKVRAFELQLAKRNKINITFKII
jgi:hypothetical protein